MQIAEVVRSFLETLLVWPVAVMFVAVLLRQPLTKLLNNIQSGKFGSVEFYLDRARDNLVRNESPASASDDEVTITGRGGDATKDDPALPTTDGSTDSAPTSDQRKARQAPPEAEDFKPDPRRIEVLRQQEEVSHAAAIATLDKRRKSWRDFLDHLALKAGSTPGQAIERTWREFSERVEVDRRRTQGYLERNGVQLDYPPSWRLAVAQFNEASLRADLEEVSAKVAGDFLSTADGLYNAHLNTLQGSLRRARNEEVHRFVQRYNGMTFSEVAAAIGDSRHGQERPPS